MIKKLPIIKPPINTYLSHGYYLSAMMNYKEFLPWFHSNYIHLKCLKELTQELVCDLNFFFPDGLDYLQSVPFIKKQFIFQDILSYFNYDIVNFIKTVISEGYYICTFVDEYYIQSKYLYQKEHNSHRILLYGFDDELNIFNICGWNKNGIYSINELVSFNDFAAAFQSKYNEDILLSKRGIFCFKLDVSYFESHQYKLDIEYVYREINDYLASNNVSEKFGMYHNKLDPEKYSFGIGVYNDFNKYLHKLVDNEANASNIAVHAIWEHKKCMLMRINYLKEMKLISDDGIVNEYKEIEKKAYQCRSLMLKYRSHKEENIIRRMLNLIRIIENEERNLLEKLLYDIKSTNSI